MARRKKKKSPNSHLKNKTNTTVTSQGRSKRKNQQEKKKHGCNQTDNKTYLFLHNFCYYRLETNTPCLFCFPGDVSVELISNLTSLLFCFLEKCIFSSPAMYIGNSLSLGLLWLFSFLDCQYLKHYSMTLLCSNMDSILSPPPPPRVKKNVCFVFVFNYVVS